MKVNWFPLYGPEGASSRLRVYTLHQALLELGHSSELRGSSSDVAVYQKVAPKEPAEYSLLRVFDCDDLECYSRIPSWADLVTTDTALHAETLRETTDKPVVVVPDPIDYCPKAPLPQSQGDGVVWFGFYGNFPSAEPWVREFTQAGIPVRLITNREFQPGIPGVEVVPWQLDTFVQDLRKSHMAILSHEGADLGKSNNKAITAITLGLPCIVSNTPAYRELSHSLKASCWIPGQLSLLELYQNPAAFSPEDQLDIWADYSPQAVAYRWLQTMKARMP